MQEHTKMGKIVSEGGKYFVVLADGRHELPSQLAGGEEALKELAGQEVEVLFSDPVVFPIALRPKRRPPILCYLPAGPWLDVAHSLAHGALLEASVVSAAEHIKLRPTCYVPAPWVIKGVENQVRVNLANELLEKGIINKQVHEQIVGH